MSGSYQHVCGSHAGLHTWCVAHTPVFTPGVWLTLPSSHLVCGSRACLHTWCVAHMPVSTPGVWGSRACLHTWCVAHVPVSTPGVWLTLPSPHLVCGSHMTIGVWLTHDYTQPPGLTSMYGFVSMCVVHLELTLTSL